MGYMRTDKLMAQVAAVLFAQGVVAHGVGPNTEGCRNNGKTGDDHCHQAPGTRNQSLHRCVFNSPTSKKIAEQFQSAWPVIANASSAE